MTWANSEPILVFIGLSVLDYRPDVRDRRTSDVRQTDARQHHRFMSQPIRGGGIKFKMVTFWYWRNRVVLENGRKTNVVVSSFATKTSTLSYKVTDYDSVFFLLTHWVALYRQATCTHCIGIPVLYSLAVLPRDTVKNYVGPSIQ